MNEPTPGCILSSVAELREAVSLARAQRTCCVGLVPTMGALHDGHLSLIAAARERCDLVIATVFVNPAQFDEAADLAAYPRSLRGDAAAAFAAGADLLFAPQVADVYPRDFSTSIDIGPLGEVLEGAVRGPKHFRGVATVVLKLFNMALPDVAFFGAKDAQQVAVIRRLVADLNVPVQVEQRPTVREHDGLAMSSRNRRLSPAERRRAPAIHEALLAAEALAREGHQSAELLLAAASRSLGRARIDAEYLTLVDARSFEPLRLLDRPALLLLAARLGRTRLIDNIELTPIAGSMTVEGQPQLPARRRAQAQSATAAEVAAGSGVPA